ncbi:MAG: hypothetical protein ACOC8E_00055 [Planctomycetota bacterium]
MDELTAIEKLAHAARREEPPVDSVADRVILRLAAPGRARVRALSFFAAGSAIAAAVILVAGLTLANGADPMAELWAPFEVISLW